MDAALPVKTSLPTCPLVGEVRRTRNNGTA
jgi:hypothetical protein